MRFVKKLRFLVLVMAICGVGTAHATDLHGEVSGMLTLEGSPYRVIENAFVPEGQILKINQGVTVEFAPGTQLEVTGLLEILGTPSHEVILTGTDAANPWKGISISGKDADGGHISYAHITGCTIGLQFRDVQFSVLHSRITSSERAFLIADDSDITLDAINGDVLADKLSATAMKVKDSRIMVRDSRFSVEAEVVDQNEHLLGMVFDNANGLFTTSHITLESESAAIFAMNIVDCSEDLDINHCSIKLDTNSDSEVTELVSASIRVAGSSNVTLDHLSIHLIVPRSLVYGIYGSGTSYIYLKNSIIANTAGEDYEQNNIPFYLNTAFSPRLLARYNCLFNVHADEGGNGIDNLDYIVDDPRWESPADEDYRIQENSPCIDAGVPDVNEPRDPDGSVTDIGKHYYHQQLFTPEPGEKVIPEKFALESAYPNPFNSTVRFSLNVEKLRNTDIAIYDVLGRRVSTLYSGSLPSGQHAFHWDGFSGVSHASSGVYFIHISSQNQVLTQRIQLVR